ncbi:MAG: DUF2970 domain-containing protein [Burkholderiales bacterium]|nr:DUF2970 domain-containing protein [Burkholderiales bacterium]
MMAEQGRPERPAPAPTERQASLLQTVKAVAASFFGVRGRSAHEQDMAKLNPVVVIGVGIALAAVFVLTLITIVRMVVK